MTFTVTHTGTADEGDDYTVGTLTIAAGQTVGRMDPKLEVVDDTVSEGEETIELTVTAAGYEEAGCTIRLEDDESAPPMISGLEPAAGPVGASVAITGTGFGANRGSSTVSFNQTPVRTYTSWSDTSIVVEVPTEARTGNVVVTVGGVASNGVAFTVPGTAPTTGVTVRPTALTIAEGGRGTYTVVLDTEPAAEVTVSVFAGSGLSVDRFPVFGVTDWATPQTVTVTADQDANDQDETHRISHQTSSTDGDYHGLTVDEVEVTVTDDEGTGSPGGTLELTVSTTELRITEGNSGRYTVVLNAEPPEAVMVAVTAPAGGDLTVMPSLLTFTLADWNTPQEVTVTVAEDTDLLDEVQSITHTVTLASEALRFRSGGGVRFAAAAAAREYVYLGGRLVAIDPGGGAPSVASVVVTIDDDDDPTTPGVPAMTGRLRMSEGHTGAYTLELASEPSDDVRIEAMVVEKGIDGVADVSVSPASLTFKAATPTTPSNWDTPKWVTVTVGHDSDLANETEIIGHTVMSADPDYDEIAVDNVVVEIRDTGLSPSTATGGPDRIDESLPHLCRRDRMRGHVQLDADQHRHHPGAGSIRHCPPPQRGGKRHGDSRAHGDDAL